MCCKEQSGITLLCFHCLQYSIASRKISSSDTQHVIPPRLFSRLPCTTASSRLKLSSRGKHVNDSLRIRFAGNSDWSRCDTMLSFFLSLSLGYVTVLFRCRDYVAWKGMMIGEWIVEYILGGNGRGVNEVLSWHLPGGTRENHEQIRISGVLAEIRTKYFPNRSLEEV
jgi:hypothetical protein